MNWQVDWWVSFLIRVIISVFPAWLIILLLREKITLSRVSAAISTIFVIGFLWLVNIEGATRLVFYGFEIDRRVESAQAILDRLEKIEGRATSTTNNLETIQKKALQTTKELQNLITQENKKFEIQKLQNKAIAGDITAYISLLNHPTDDPELKEYILTAEHEIKGFYIGKSKISGLKIYRENKDGSKTHAKLTTTSWLINLLKTSDKWDYRAKAAQLLGKRSEIGVPEALLYTMENDLNLWVRREALSSFSAITKFKPRDVFQFFETKYPESPLKWYEWNKLRIKKALKKQEKDSPQDKAFSSKLSNTFLDNFSKEMKSLEPPLPTKAIR